MHKLTDSKGSTLVTVKSRRGRKTGPKEIVGEVEIDQVDSWAEACQLAGSESEALKVFNAQWATNAKNKIRAKATAVMSAAKVRAQAVTDVLSDTEKIAAMAKVGQEQGVEAMRAYQESLISARMEEIRTAQSAPDAPDEDEEDEEEERTT